VRVLENGAGQTVVACVADGAGSASRSDLGSALTCESIVQSATDYQESHGDFRQLQMDQVVHWCSSAREKLRATAEHEGCQLRDLATTLCTAILAPECSLFFQIGDGAITVGTQGVYGVVFWPQSGEYANVTNFITSDTFQNALEFQATPRPFTELALFTDGIERLALNFERQTPHLPFFQPLFHAVRNSQNGSQLSGDLGQFLQSSAVANRSDDDKTLILCTRLAQSAGGDTDAGA
jgi:hypothetical protein